MSGIPPPIIKPPIPPNGSPVAFGVVAVGLVADADGGAVEEELE